MTQRTNANPKKWYSRADFLLGACVVAVAGLAYAGKSIKDHMALSQARSQGVKGPFVVVQHSGTGILFTGSLAEDATYLCDVVEGKNQVRIQDGEVFVEWADCPNQVCVETGKISAVGDVIACLPHHILIEVVADPSDASRLA